MREVNIKVSSDFSRFPAGRFYDDGEFSGQRFREEFLVPYLRDPGVSKVGVDLDGVLMQGSSFLEEAFGGLIRECGFSQGEVEEKLVIKTRMETLSYQVWSYIKKAKAKK